MIFREECFHNSQISGHIRHGQIRDDQIKSINAVSKWIAGIIKEKIATEWPKDFVGLAGSWGDEFPTIEEIRASLEAQGLPIGPLDNLIAGTALSLNATLVTHNTKEFNRVKGLRIEDWLS